MADKILLPGTAMEVIEKYPLSRRLDHPDFGDVHKTTFAKGVITDFEKIADDPIQVKSRVKVKIGDGEESDFIPIFFHPKELYWDGEDGVLAQDLDEETAAFKQAWQSFRCDDEVAVMLKEGIPVAVLGFADGVPRIGEDILGLEFDGHLCGVQVTAHNDKDIGDLFVDFDADMEGTDGKLLKLLTEHQLQYVKDFPEEKSSFWDGCHGGGGMSTNYAGTVYYEGWPEFAFNFGEGYWWCITNTRNAKLYAVQIPIGPILYSIRIAITKTIYECRLFHWQAEVHGGSMPENLPNPIMPDQYDGYTPPNTEGVEWSQVDWESEHNKSTFYDPLDVIKSYEFLWLDGSNCNVYDGMVQPIDSEGNPIGPLTSIGSWNTAGDYDSANNNDTGEGFTQVENYDITIASVAATLYDEALLNDPLNELFEPQNTLIKIIDYFYSWNYDPIPKFYRRPHTKAELQAVGMWPTE